MAVHQGTNTLSIIRDYLMTQRVFEFSIAAAESVSIEAIQSLMLMVTTSQFKSARVAE